MSDSVQPRGDQGSSEGRNWSRREFFQTSAILAATPWVSAPLASPVFGQEAGDLPPLKIGLVGCGGRGTGAATQALRADPGVVLHALGDVF